MRVGRNDPCPCGSGKKYKKCCLQEGPTDAEEGVDRLRRAQGSIEAEMAEFVTEWVGDDALAEAKHEFELEGEYAGMAADEEQLFSPWALYEWHPKLDRATRRGRRKKAEQRVEFDDRTVSEAFIDAHDDLPEQACSFLTCVSEEPCSFYDVVDVVPGRRLLLRDILRETQHVVVERAGSKTLRRGDIIFARVVPLIGVALIVGCGAVAIPPDWKRRVLYLRESMRDAFGTIETGHLRVLAPDVRLMYFGLRQILVNPPTRKLANTDGDPLELHTLTYAIPSAEATFQSLKSLAVGVPEEDLLGDAVRDAAGRLTKAEFPWLRLGNKMNASWDNTVLGQVRIEGTTLTVEVNSAKRAQRIQKEIRKRLGNQVHEPTVAVKTAEEFQRPLNRGRADRHSEKAVSESARLYASPEVREALRDLMERHWEAWIHEKIPALGGKTPLQAVKDPEGREMVEALLIEAERSEERRPAHDHRYDVDRVRIRLGLPARRKVTSIDRLER